MLVRLQWPAYSPVHVAEQRNNDADRLDDNDEDNFDDCPGYPSAAHAELIVHYSNRDHQT